MWGSSGLGCLGCGWTRPVLMNQSPPRSMAPVGHQGDIEGLGRAFHELQKVFIVLTRKVTGKH